MGCGKSKLEGPGRSSIKRYKAAGEYVDITSKYNLDEQNMAEVYNMFRKKDANLDGDMDYEEFCKAWALEVDIISEKFFKLLDYNKTGSIGFREFLLGMSRFGGRNDAEASLMFAFHLCDEDNSGTVETEEFAVFLQLMWEGNQKDSTWGEKNAPNFKGQVRKLIQDLEMKDDRGKKSQYLTKSNFIEIAKHYPDCFVDAVGVFHKMHPYGKAAAKVMRQLHADGHTKQFVEDVKSENPAAFKHLDEGRKGRGESKKGIKAKAKNFKKSMTRRLSSSGRDMDVGEDNDDFDADGELSFSSDANQNKMMMSRMRQSLVRRPEERKGAKVRRGKKSHREENIDMSMMMAQLNGGGMPPPQQQMGMGMGMGMAGGGMMPMGGQQMGMAGVAMPLPVMGAGMQGGGMGMGMGMQGGGGGMGMGGPGMMAGPGGMQGGGMLPGQNPGAYPNHAVMGGY